jgi:hypothetical protein
MTPNGWHHQAVQFDYNRKSDQILREKMIKPNQLPALFQQYFENDRIPVSDFFSIARAEMGLQNDIK